MGAEFKVTIAAVDKATAVVRLFRMNMRREMRDAIAPLTGLSAPLLHLGQSVTRLADTAGVFKLARAAGAAARGVTRVGKAAVHLAGTASIAGIGIGALGAGLMALAREASDYGEEIEKSAVKTGLGVAEIARLHHVAEATHIETAILDKGLVKLNRTLAEVAAGKNKDAAGLFHKLGIDARDARTHIVRTAAQVLPQLADAFQRNTNAAVRARMANAAFGKSGQELLPILALGGEEIERLAAEYERYFGKLSPQMIAAMKEGDDAFDHLSLATKGLRLSVGSALIPALTELMVPLTEWIANNREIISSNVGKWAKGVADYIVNIDWKQAGADALEFAKEFKEAIFAIRDVVVFVADTLRFINHHIRMITGALLGFAVGGPLGALVVGGVGAVGDMAADDVDYAESQRPTSFPWRVPSPGSVFSDDMGETDVERPTQRNRGASFTPLPAPAFASDMTRALSSQPIRFYPIPASERDVSREINALNVNGLGLDANRRTAPTKSEVAVKIDINNLPQGSRVNAKASPGVDFDLGPRFAY